ncbi:MAG TPA: bacillithiol biosynthesis cysteine-adding enzyme BshC [archaeon]|nr:bacillithiol biosynthesis cysteine-adding enzyme BshC [archaeon]
MNDFGLEMVICRPGINQLVEDYLKGKSTLLSFYGGHYAERGRLSALAGRIDKKFDRKRAAAILEAQIAFPNVKNGKQRLERFVKESGFIITTGQQPLLFGGPLYVLYKCLTAVRLADHASKTLGVPVLPVFWNASEDHDFAEITTISLLDPANRLETLSFPQDFESLRPACLIEIGEHILTLKARLEELLPETDFRPWVLELLSSSYRQGKNLGCAFSEYLSRLFADYGLFVVDACHPALRSECSDLFEAEIFDAASSIKAFKEQSKALSWAGYQLQITPLDQDTSLFLIQDGVRTKLQIGKRAGEFLLKGTGKKVTSAEIRTLLEQKPESFSPGVLMRTLVEANLFGTLCYVAGPGEISYYAQMRSLYELRQLEMPVIYPRLSGILVESKIAKVLQKYGVDAESLQTGADKLAGELLAASGSLARVIEETERLKSFLELRLAVLAKLAERIDPTLAGPVKSTSGSLAGNLERLEKKVTAAAKKNNDTMVSQLHKAQAHLWPGGKPQEREIAAVYYLFRYGRELLGFLQKNVAIDLG